MCLVQNIHLDSIFFSGKCVVSIFQGVCVNVASSNHKVDSLASGPKRWHPTSATEHINNNPIE